MNSKSFSLPRISATKLWWQLRPLITPPSNQCNSGGSRYLFPLQAVKSPANIGRIDVRPDTRGMPFDYYNPIKGRNNQYDFVLDGIETGKEPDLVQTSFQTIKNRALLYFTVHYLPCAWSPCDVLGEIFFSQNKQLYDTSQGKVCLFTLFKNPDLRTHPIS